MSFYDNCDAVVVQVVGAGAAGGVMTAVATPVNEVWQILYADAYHNDVAARTVTWFFDDLTLKVQLGDSHAALAAATRTILAVESKIVTPIYLHNGQHLSLEVLAAATDGKIVTLSLLVRKLRGVLS
jgi:hypothetical protein